MQEGGDDPPVGEAIGFSSAAEFRLSRASAWGGAERDVGFSASGTRRGKTVADLVYQGMRVLQSFPIENFCRARDFSKEGIFPLPSPEEVRSFECEINKLWAEWIARCLNWMNVGNLELGKGRPSREQRRLLEGIVRELPLVELWKNSSLEDFDPKKVWSQKTINDYGEEVHMLGV